MKILKILGAVAAVHGLAFILIFANPGCNAATRPATATDVSDASRSGTAASTSAAVSEPSVTLNFDPNAPATSSGRYSPTRPGTPAAAALEPAPAPAAEVIPAKTYTVVKGDSLWSVAKKNNLTVTELATANNLSANAELRLGQKLLIPSRGLPADNGNANGFATYRVKSGDTLGKIAMRGKTTTTALMKLNGLTSETVRVGQELKLPPGVIVAEAAPQPESSQKSSAGSVVHVVQPGESLSTIAQQYRVKVSEIATANSITDPSKVRAGMTLTIPTGTVPKSAKSPEEAAPTTPLIPIIQTGEQDVDPGQRPPAQVPIIRIEEPSNPPKRS